MRLSEAENRIGLLTQELERVNHNLRMKMEEILNFENKYRGKEQ